MRWSFRVSLRFVNRLTRILLGIALVLTTSLGGTALAQSKFLTREEILLISPKAKEELVTVILKAENDFTAYGLTTRLRLAHFLAQVMTETGGLNRLDENMNYSFNSLMRVFSRKIVTEAKAREIAGQPLKVANWVYRNRLGNGDWHTGDGWSYRGSGFIQLTGRDNFRARGREVGLPMEKDPEIARRPREGLTAALAYWKARNINAAADNNDKLRVRVLVNGPAAHGFPQSKIWFDRAWTRVFRQKAGFGFEAAEELASAETLNEAEAFDEILKESGLLPPGFETDANPEGARAQALKEFQREVGLPETGKLDEATQEELLDPHLWRHEDGPDLMPAPPNADLEQTVTFQLIEQPKDVESAMETEIAETEPASGTGETVADANIREEDLQALAEATAIYPEYEMGSGTSPETFVPFAVIGEDTRVAVVDTTGFSARAIVQILFQTGDGIQRLCTGTMVSEDTVLTAAHCIHSGTIFGTSHKNFRITPGRNIGAAPFGRCLGREAFVLSGWTSSQTFVESRYYDLGAIKLDCEVGNRTGWLGLRALGDEELDLKTTVQGYSSDRPPTGRQWISEDQLRFLWEHKGFYQNDTFGGTSGAPVFMTGTNDVLIGVHTNGRFGNEEPWASNNAFTRFTPERLVRIQEWIGR